MGRRTKSSTLMTFAFAFSRVCKSAIEGGWLSFSGDSTVNGLQAVLLSQTMYSDTILMAIQMPEMDGITAARAFATTKSPCNSAPDRSWP